MLANFLESIKDTPMGARKKDKIISTGAGRVQTHDLLITRRDLYPCVVTAALQLVTNSLKES